jgi:hypothetical protein
MNGESNEATGGNGGDASAGEGNFGGGGSEPGANANDSRDNGQPFQQTMSWTGAAPAEAPVPQAPPAPSAPAAAAPIFHADPSAEAAAKPQVVWSSAPAPSTWSSGAIRRDE